MKRLLFFLIFYLLYLPSAFAKTVNVYCEEKEAFLENMETNEKYYSPHYFPIAYWEFSINENVRELILKHKQKTFNNPKYKIINPSEYFMLAQMDNGGNFVGSSSIEINRLKGTAILRFYEDKFIDIYYLHNCSREKPVKLF